MIATVSPSTTGKMLNEVLSPHGLMFNGGHCPDVGVGGFLLQGGQGWCCRDWGWSAESIESMQVVTSSAQVVTASRTENEDLFWAARGAGPGFFGVVVSFTIKLRHLVTLYGSTYIYDSIENYDEVSKWYLNVCPTVPSDCEMVMLGFTSERIMPHLSPSRPLLLVRALAFTDDEDHARKTLSAFAVGIPNLESAHVADFCQRGSFAEEYARQAADNPEGRYWTQNAWLDGPYDKVAQSMKRAYTHLPTKNSFALHFSMAPLRPIPKDMAFDIQTEHTFSLYTIAPSDTSEFDEACQQYQKDVFGPIDKLTPQQGGSVGIYLGDSDLKVRPARFMSAENWKRWCEIRRKWDKKRVFAGYDGETEESQWNRNLWE
jgi:FAD/FMN-containing dehydrogenase